MKTFRTCAILLLLAIALTRCANQGFPECCDSSGFRDTPYKITNIFGFKTGVKDIYLSNADDTRGYLFIISSADLLTLLAAANSESLPGTGVVTGEVSYKGNPVSEVRILPTDVNGKPMATEIKLIPDGNEPDLPITIRNLFYNSLGRVPDVILPGTSTGGGFTIFNVEPGEIFFWASQGGRGSGHWTVFDDQVSIGSFEVIPVPKKEVELFGRVVEDTGTNLTRNLPVGTEITFLGYADNLVFHTNAQGVYETVLVETPDGDSELRSVVLPTNGEFMLKVEAEGYETTYDRIITPLNVVKTLLPFQKYTLNLRGMSKEFIEHVSLVPLSKPNEGEEFRKITIDPSKGIIFGTSRARGVGSPIQGDTRVIVTNEQGDKTGDVVYIDLELNPVLDRGEQSAANGRFIVFNVDPGDVMLRGVSKPLSLRCFGSVELLTGGQVMKVIEGAVNLGSIFLTRVPQKECFKESTKYTVGLSGTLLGHNQQSVPGVTVSFLGIKDLTAVSDANGIYSIADNEDPLAITPLLANTDYVVRLSKPRGEEFSEGDPVYIDTYSEIHVENWDTTRNLPILDNQFLSVNGSMLPLPMIHGRLVDTENGLSAQGVSVKVVGLDSKEAGAVYYYNTDGTLSATLTESTTNGGFVVAGLPRERDNLGRIYNIIITSGDDSGTRLVRIYGDDSVTTTTVRVNKVVPQNVNMSGRILDMHGNAIANALVTIVGKPRQIKNPKLTGANADLNDKPELDTFSSDTNGFFEKEMPANAVVILKVEAAGCMDTYNYDVRISEVDMEKDIFCTTASETQEYRQAAGLALAPPEDDETEKTGIAAGQILAPALVNGDMLGKAVDVADNPSSMVVDYLNNDQFIDLAVAGKTDMTISIYLGNANGNFSLAPNGNGVKNLPEEPDGIILADLNLDSIKDIVTFNRSSGKIMVMLGRGDGPVFDDPVAFCAGETDPFGACSAEFSQMVIEDFNNDEFPDIALIDPSARNIAGLSLFLNNLDGTFTAEGSTVLTASSLSALAVKDVNGDKLPDIVVASRAEKSIRVHLSTGDGKFTDGSEDLPLVGKVSYPVAGRPVAVFLVDLNSDSLPEIITAHDDNNTITVLKATQDVVTVVDYTESHTYMVAGTPVDITAGDIDSDSRMDLLVSHVNPSGISIFFGNGDGTLNSIPLVKAIGEGISAIHLTDLNRDAKSDVVILDSPANMVRMLFREDHPLNGIEIEVNNEAGDSIGQIFYMDNTGALIDPALSSTSESGRFLVFDLPVGFAMISAKWDEASNSGARGNSIIRIEPDSLTYTQMQVTTLPPGSVLIEGHTMDPVGAEPGGTGITPIKINVLGTKIEQISEDVIFSEDVVSKARYTFDQIPSSSEFVIKLEYIGEKETTEE